MRSFANELNRLALAVSLISDATWTDIKKSLDAYFQETVGAHFFRLMVDGIRIGEEPGLETIWASTETKQKEADLIFQNSAYTGLRTYSYHKGRFLWVVADDKETLKREKANLVDLWGNEEDLPVYQSSDDSAKTFIAAPLGFGGKYFGVFVIEHREYKDFTPQAKQEIETFSHALARIVRVWQSTHEQYETLSTAFSEFKDYLKEARSPIERPKIFFAYPENADQKVLESVDQVLEEIAETVEKVSWQDRPHPGNINADLVRQITTSDLGICYVSELVDTEGNGDQELRFTDNQNVLFEAGMFHALSATTENPNRGWIPIREHEDLAGPPCFDIASERMIIVKRENGTLSQSEFQEQLQNMILSVVGDR